MNRKGFDIQEFMNRDFYIVDCKNFIYFPRKIKVIGFEMSPDSLVFTINIKGFGDEWQTMYKEQLEQFKTFDEAKKYAKKLNEIPKNKKRAEDWNSPKNQYNRLVIEQELKETFDKVEVY